MTKRGFEFRSGRPISRRKFIEISGMTLGAAAFASFLAACGKGEPTPTPSPAAPGQTAAPAPSPAAPAPAAPAGPTILRMGAHREPQSLDPSRDTEVSSYYATSLIFEEPLRRDVNLKYEARLAQSWEWTGDNSVLFKLRQGVTFHDGAALTAAAIKAQMEYWQGPETPFGFEYRGFSIDVIDDHTFAVVTEKPTPLAVDRMTRSIQAPQQMADAAAMANRPVGTGPCKLKEWRRGDKIVLERNPSYWGTPFAFDEMHISFIPEGSVRLTALFNGDVDMISNLPVHLAAEIEARDGFYVAGSQSTQLHLLYCRTIDPSPLQDVRVRQAVAHAVDIDEIIDQLFGGYAKRQSQLTTDVFFGHNPNLQPYAHDPARARQLLADAGYPNGLELSFATSRHYREYTEAVAGQLQAAGIRARVTVLEDAAYAQQRRGQVQEFDLVYGEWGHGVLDDAGVLIGAACEVPFNVTGYCNPDLDKAYFGKVASALDEKVRLEGAYEGNAIVHRDLPVIPMFSPYILWGLSDKIRYQPNALDKRPLLDTITPVA